MSALTTPAMASTRVLFVPKDGTVITGRSMDWTEDLKSSMWVLPRGMKRDVTGGKNSISWQSKCGSLIVSGYDIGTSEGMNNNGPVGNMLALVGSPWSSRTAGGRRNVSGSSAREPGGSFFRTTTRLSPRPSPT